MARGPIFDATLQAALLGAISNILAQLITAYRAEAPLEIDWIPVLQFLMFSIISTPPNFIWQGFLESTFPARLPPPHPKKTDGKKKQDPDQQPLNVRNTIIKFVLDQTIGAAVNTLLFSTYIHSMHIAMAGAPKITNFNKATSYWISPGAIDLVAVDGRVVLDKAFDEFWSIIFAGMKLWPAVSLVNFTMVKTVKGRNLLGACAGLIWGIYMSMVAAR